MSKNTVPKQNRSRIIFVFLLIVVLFIALAFRTAYQQLINGDEYATKATKQQTQDSVISAFRGSIFDRNGNTLVTSATTNTIWIRPVYMQSNGKTEADVTENLEHSAKVLSEILNLNYDEVYELCTSDKQIYKLAKDVDEDTADKLREEDLYGVDILEVAKRYYPLKDFACHILGITNDDSEGITGLELSYNDTLSGTDGRWVTNTDRNNNTLIFGSSKYYDAENGYSIVTTIDSNVQLILKEYLDKYAEEYEMESASGIIMDPETGEILALYQTGSYDLNNPRSSQEGDEEYYNSLSDSEKVAYWNQMWRNSCISDVYEPGSVMKLITTALALDAGVTTTDEVFYCGGVKQVEDRQIHCWVYPESHEYINTAGALRESCNIVMMELMERLGSERYYNGLRTFCITEKTGVDYPGEASNIIYSENEAGPVELATMSFGQGIAVTPISILSAVASFANEGKLMTPHFVKQILDSEGNVVETIEPEVRNITVSAETCEEILSIMEDTILYHGWGLASLKGYSFGGKTGTAYIPVEGGYTGEEAVITSFAGIAPIDDPKYVMLLVMEKPNLPDSLSTAAFCGRDIVEALMLNDNIAPDYTEEELAEINADKVTVPDLTGMKVSEAVNALYHQDLELVSGEESENISELTIVDQYPKADTLVEPGTAVTVYFR